MSITDWITAGSLALLVIFAARAALATCRLADVMVEQSYPEQVTRNINRKLNNIMGITEDIQGAVALLHEIVGEIAEAGNEAQARIAALESQLAEAEAEAADPAVVEALKAEVADVKAKADVLAATFPHVPTEPPAETPVEEPTQ